MLGSSPMHGASPMLGASPNLVGSSSVTIPKFQHPSHSLLEDNGFKQIKYAKWFKRCIEERQKQGEGMCGGCPLGGREVMGGEREGGLIGELKSRGVAAHITDHEPLSLPPPPLCPHPSICSCSPSAHSLATRSTRSPPAIPP